MNVTVKKPQTDDEIRGKAFVHWKAWQEAYSSLLDGEFLASRTLDSCVEKAYKWKDGILIAKDGERVVGFAGFGRCRDADLPDAGEVTAIYVLADHYGRGVGAALMSAALEALDRPQTVVWLIKGNERAFRFYEKFGFRADGCEKELTLGKPVRLLRMVRGL